MTENEAKKTLEIFDKERKEHMANMPSNPYFDRVKADNFTQSLKTAIKALEEIQQYRAIGTVEECREERERERGEKPDITIGQTEEDKLACCPVCDRNIDWTYNGYWRKGNPNYCSCCGQKLDWSE